MATHSAAQQFRTVRVDKSSPTPVYAQLAAAIGKLIHSGTIMVGATLPPERLLCEQFGVSRMTLRQAYDLLQHEGLIESQRGRGTIVSPRRMQKQQQEMRSFTEEIEERGSVASSNVIGFRKVHPDVEDREFFAIPEDEWLYEIERVRLADNIPVAHEIAHIPQYLCQNLDRFNLATQSLYLILEENYGLVLKYCIEEISAARPSRRQRELLQVQANVPLLTVRRRTYTDQETPAELSRTAYRGDLYTAIVRSTRSIK